MNDQKLSYREVLLDGGNPEHWNEIALDIGGTQSTLQDIKVAEKAGGYCYEEYSGINSSTRNRFIFWRTCNDFIELSEISLDINLIGSNIRYKFNDSPVISVNIVEQNDQIVLLVATVCSLHKINFPSPQSAVAGKDLPEKKSHSIFYDAKNLSTNKQSSICHVIGQSASLGNTVPSVAASCLSFKGQEAFFILGYANSLMLFTINCENGQTTSTVIKENYKMPRLLSNLTEALRGKQSLDSQQVVSMVFNTINKETYLTALHRDNQIRMWSTTSHQCVCTYNCAREESETQPQGAQNNMLRKVNERSVCAFLCYLTDSEFSNIQIGWDELSNFTMSKTSVVPAPQCDLSDFQATESHIWGLWCNVQGEFSISNYYLIPNYGVNWLTAAMEPAPDRCNVSSMQGRDPRQAYCSYIFHPGKFDKSVISKALMMFRRLNIMPEMNLSISTLRDRVSQAIEEEIENEIKDFDFSDDEYADIATSYWERFYSCCEQYHLKSCQPIGLIFLETMNIICVVKKNAISLLRPCEYLEHLMIAGEGLRPDNIDIPLPSEEKIAMHDLHHLVILLSMIDGWFGDEIKSDFENKLFQMKDPDTIVRNLVSEMLTASRAEGPSGNLLLMIRQRIKDVSDIKSAIILLLNILRLGPQENFCPIYLSAADKTNSFQQFGNLFESHLGVSLVSESVRQFTLIRYSICVSLLTLQRILIDTFGLSCEVLEAMRSSLLPQTLNFLQSYHAMLWICEKPINRRSLGSVESCQQRLRSLELNDARRPVRNSRLEICSLLKLFLETKGLSEAFNLLTFSDFECFSGSAQCQNSLLPIVTKVAQILSPISENFLFGEWLFLSYQFTVIQEYARLLNGWCNWNVSSRQFILAIAYLEFGETHKAYDFFLKSKAGIFTERFLNNIIFKQTPNLTAEEAIARYYLILIELFERQSALDYAIIMAESAAGLLENHAKHQAMFQTIVFNNHLALEHYQEAYNSLTSNVEIPRRKECLRQLVVRLFNQKRLDLLIVFPYVGLQDDFENIVESRARSTIIENNVHYDFMYAFHVHKDNMRKAASSMYEKALRLQLESDTEDSLQSRYNCLLASITSLDLVDENYKWIAKPILEEECLTPEEENMRKLTHQIVILEIKDIRKELVHTEALLILSRHKKDSGSCIQVEPQELSKILANYGLYTAALKLAAQFDISLVPIFEALTLACIRIVDLDSGDKWSWLKENDLADLPCKNSAADMAWLLLEYLINKYEHKTAGIRKYVIDKILNNGAFVPHWLQSKFKSEDPSALLRLYVLSGRLLEGAEIAKDYLTTLSEKNLHFYDLPHSINSLDLLMEGLRLNSEYPEYKECLDELTQKLTVDLSKLQ